MQAIAMPIRLNMKVEGGATCSGSMIYIVRKITQMKSDKPYLLTPWCTVLLEKLTGLRLVKKFPAFHGTRKLITALTSVRHLSLSWASPIQSTYPHPTSWRSILILSTHLRLGLPSGLLPSGFLTKTLYTPSPHPYAPHAQPISFFSILSPAQYWVRSTNHLAPRYAISSIPPFLGNYCYKILVLCNFTFFLHFMTKN